MTSKGAIDVEFYLEGKRYAVREWHAAPRASELVLLHGERPPMFAAKEEEEDKHRATLIAFVVVQVIWGYESPRHNRQLVRVSIERA